MKLPPSTAERPLARPAGAWADGVARRPGGRGTRRASAARRPEGPAPAAGVETSTARRVAVLGHATEPPQAGGGQHQRVGPPPRACRSRVPTLPRIGTIARSGLGSARSWASRRGLPVATRAPDGRGVEAPAGADPTRREGRREAGPRRSQAPRDLAGQVLGRVDARSSCAPSRSARSTPRTKRDLSPGSPSEEASTSSAPPDGSATCPA